ncbi:hypothetical protein Pelo_15316 [Pelomyxa schiedti]|nr:hypothetical protein Pelo_15316 [Pelomyxa schiedti]
MQGCFIHAKSAEAIATVLSTNNSIKRLYLQSCSAPCNLCSGAFQLIRVALINNSTLLELKLGGNHLDHDRSKLLADVISLNATLTRLDLSWCHIEGAAYPILCEAIAKNCTLTTIDLQGNIMKEEDINYISTMLATNSCLSTFNIKGCQVQPEAILDALRSNFSLTQLQIEGQPHEPESIKSILTRNNLFRAKVQAAFTNKGLLRCARKYIRESAPAPLNYLLTLQPAVFCRKCKAISGSCIFRGYTTVMYIIEHCTSTRVAAVLLFRKSLHTTCLTLSDVHNVMQVLLHSTALGVRDTGKMFALHIIRQYTEARDWDTVHMLLSEYPLLFAFLDLSYLSLTDFPVRVAEAIPVQITTLDLKGNKLQVLPHCMHKVPNLVFEENPLSSVPDMIKACNDWTRLREFLQYKGSSEEWNYKKIIIVGEAQAGKTTLLKCLKAGGKRCRTHHYTPTGGITFHSHFNILSSQNWVAWDFGGNPGNPLHQFFLRSDSIVVVVLNIAKIAKWLETTAHSSCELCPSIKILLDWIKQIQASHQSNKLVQCLLVGTHMDEIAGDTISVSRSALGTILTEIGKVATESLHFVATFSVNCSTGDGYQFPEPTADIQFNKKTSIQAIVRALDDIYQKNKILVSTRWVTLHHAIMQQGLGNTISWTDFTKKASTVMGSCKGDQFDLVELEMCADFLADAGLIIHFHNPLKYKSWFMEVSEHRLKELVILNPEWLFQVINCTVTIKAQWLLNSEIRYIDCPRIFSPATLNEALTTLELCNLIHKTGGNYLIPHQAPEHPTCAIATSSPVTSMLKTKYPIPFWCPIEIEGCSCSSRSRITHPDNCVATGRVIEFSFLPPGLFPLCICRILSTPGIRLLSWWKHGLVVSVVQPLTLCRVTSFITEEVTSISVWIYVHVCSNAATTVPQCRRTTENQKALFERLGASIFISLVESIMSETKCHYKRLYETLNEQFACQSCIGYSHFQLCQDCNASHSSEDSVEVMWFTKKEIELAIRNRVRVLKCKACMSSHMEAGAFLSIVAPDLTLNQVPIIHHSELEVGEIITSNRSREIYTGILRETSVAIERFSCESSGGDSLAFIYKIACAHSIPIHSNLVQIFGACITTTLSVASELVIPLNPHTELASMGKLASRPDLHSILCYLGNAADLYVRTMASHSKHEVSDIKNLNAKYKYAYKYFPLSLIEKILFDILSGVHHLHNQNPPMAHGDLNAGNIMICSLDPNGTGPWAKASLFSCNFISLEKIADFGITDLVSPRNIGVASSEVLYLPPEVLGGGKYTPQSDIWCFGMITTRMLDMFSSPFSHLKHQPQFCQVVESNGKRIRVLNDIEMEMAIQNAFLVLGIDTVNKAVMRSNCLLCSPWDLDPLVALICPPCICSHNKPETSPDLNQNAHIRKLLWVGTWLWCGYQDGTISILKFEQSREGSFECQHVVKWRPHHSQITAMLWIEDFKDGSHCIHHPIQHGVSQCAITATSSGDMKIWSSLDAPIETLSCTTNSGITSLICVCQESDNCHLWGGHETGDITVWTLSSTGLIPFDNFNVSKLFRDGATTSACSIQPDGMVVAMQSLSITSPRHTLVFVCCHRGPLVVFDAPSRAPLHIIMHPSLDFTTLSLSSIAICEINTAPSLPQATIWAGTSSGKLAAWDISADDKMIHFTAGPPIQSHLHHESPIWCISTTCCPPPDTSRNHHHITLSASCDGVVLLWDAQSHNNLCRMPLTNEPTPATKTIANRILTLRAVASTCTPSHKNTLIAATWADATDPSVLGFCSVAAARSPVQHPRGHGHEHEHGHGHGHEHRHRHEHEKDKEPERGGHHEAVKVAEPVMALDAVIATHGEIMGMGVMNEEWCNKVTFRELMIRTTKQEFILEELKENAVPGAPLQRVEEVYEKLFRIILELEVTESEQWLRANGLALCVDRLCIKNKVALDDIKKLQVEECMEMQLSIVESLSLVQKARDLYIPRTLSGIRVARGYTVDIELYRVHFELHSISEKTNQFRAKLHLCMTWNKPRHILKFEPGLLVLGSVWRPTLMFPNKTQPESVTIIHEEILAAKTDREFLKYTVDIQGDWRQVFKLRRFPLDRHQLHINMKLVSRDEHAEDDRKTDLEECEVVRLLRVAPGTQCEKLIQICDEWKLKRFFRIELYDNTFYIVAAAQRNAGYYALNSLLPIFLIVGLGFTAYCYQDEDVVYKRLMLSTGLISTLVFFKFTTGVVMRTQVAFQYYQTSSLTPSQRLNYLDIYILAALLTSFGLIVGHVIAIPFASNGRMAYLKITDLVFGTFFGGLWLLLHAVILLCYPLLRKPWNSLDQQNEK